MVPRREGRSLRTVAFVVVAIALLCAPCPAAAQAVSVAMGDGAAPPGASACVPVSLSKNGVTAVGMSTDIGFDADHFSIDPATGCLLSAASQAAGVDLQCNLVQAGTLRCGAFNLSLVELPDGEVFHCCFTIAAAAPPDVYTLTNYCGAATSAGDVPADCASGTISVTTPPASPTATHAPETTPTPRPSPQPPEISLGDATAIPGGNACAPVTLKKNGLVVLGISSDVGYPEPVFNVDPARDCLLGASGLAAGLTLDCSAPQDGLIRCATYSLSLAELPDGEIYRCCFHIEALAAPGGYELTNHCGAATRDGDVPVTCGGGSIVVETGTPTATMTRTPTVTPTPTVTSCTGDCDGKGSVTVDEILTMVNIALGNIEVVACPAADMNRDSKVTIDEILMAVNNALNGCVLTPVTSGL